MELDEQKLILNSMGCCKSRLLQNIESNKNYLQTIPGNPTSDFSQEFIHAVLTGMQEVISKNKALRIKKHPAPLSNADFESYFKDVLKDLKEQESTFSQIIDKLTQEFGTPNFKEDTLIDGIRSYIEQSRITRSEVETWLQDKIKILKKEGAEIALKVSKCPLENYQKEKYIQIYHVVLDDRIQTKKDFLLGVAFEFLWIEDFQVETSNWTHLIQNVYPTFVSLKP